MRNSEPMEGGRKQRHLKKSDGEESWGNKNKNPRNYGVFTKNGFSGEAGWLCWMQLRGHETISPAISVTIRSSFSGMLKMETSDLMNGTGSKNEDEWVSLCNSFHRSSDVKESRGINGSWRKRKTRKGFWKMNNIACFYTGVRQRRRNWWQKRQSWGFRDDVWEDKRKEDPELTWRE